ncbi:MAG: type II toxin-antitoxin system Phd/YefM family antitoxin [Sulfurimonas sp.]|nr:type II toxin-antitoxin system Phd/YefM family antitoxin [Sulfurimonas sp.]
MVAYAQQEMVGITELSKSLSGYIEKVSSRTVEKLAVVRHNKPEVVILGIAEYERMKELQDYLEDLEIAQVIKERMLDLKEPVKMLSQEEMFEYLKQKGCDV